MEEKKQNLLVNTFMWLFIGLFVSFGVSYLASSSETAITTVYMSFNGLGYIIFLVLELIVAVTLGAFIRKLSPLMAKAFYLLYCALTGLSLCGIFLVYTASSIAYVFLLTSIVFGIFALIGKFTKADLSKFGIYLFVALIACILCLIINLFVKSESFNLGISVLLIIVFCGYIAYDINRLLKSDFLDENPENKSIYFAFELFIDFINLFIKLLRFFGKGRD